MQYHINEGSLNLPGHWQDSSMNILTPALSIVAGANIVISRELLPEGTHFSDYLAVQKKKFRTDLPKIVFSVEECCQIEDRPAEYWEFSWDNKGMKVEQLILVIQNSRQILTLTFSSPREINREDRDTMRATLHSFRFGVPQTAQ